MLKPYYEDDSVKIYHGDCRDILPQLEPVDAIFADPPYGVGISYGVSFTDDPAYVVQLIETDILRRGEGTEADPIRIIRQWWTFDGELVVEHDDWAWKRAVREQFEASSLSSKQETKLDKPR